METSSALSAGRKAPVARPVVLWGPRIRARCQNALNQSCLMQPDAALSPSSRETSRLVTRALRERSGRPALAVPFICCAARRAARDSAARDFFRRSFIWPPIPRAPSDPWRALRNLAKRSDVQTRPMESTRTTQGDEAARGLCVCVRFKFWLQGAREIRANPSPPPIKRGARRNRRTCVAPPR